MTLVQLQREIKTIKIENEDYVLTIELKDVHTDKIFIPEIDLWIFFVE